MMTELEKYYNKFNEEKRLKSRHGQVEFITSMKYIHKYLPKREHGQVKILDVGAGTGRYSVALAEEGYDVTAVELVKYNLGILKKKNSSVKAYQGNALKLSRFPDKEFDLIILFGPMYHLYTKEDKVKALMEAKRVLKDEGTILVAYTMNEYSVLVYGFRENHIQECLENGKLDANYRVCPSPEDLYDYVRLEDIDSYNEAAGMERLQIISAPRPCCMPDRCADAGGSPRHPDPVPASIHLRSSSPGRGCHSLPDPYCVPGNGARPICRLKKARRKWH